MPAKSQAQRRFVYGVKGKKWAEEHHYDNTGKLPERVAKKKPGAKKKAAPKKGKKAGGKKMGGKKC